MNNASFLYKNYTISYTTRSGNENALLYLHGMGCAKQDIFPLWEMDALNNYTGYSLDFPGCGQSPYIEKEPISIDFLVEMTMAFIRQIIKEKKILVIGHSMGGLVGLLVAEKMPERILTFINIEGNLAASDCFFSGKISKMDRNLFVNDRFMKYVRSLKISKNKGLQKHGTIMENQTNPLHLYDVAPSLVYYSQQAELLMRYKRLPQKKIFIYGCENNSLPYIEALISDKMHIAEIAESNHFPQYDNPKMLSRVLASFLE